MTTPARQALRELLNRRELIIAPGVYDGVSAHLARRIGQAAAYMTGASVAASGFGLPDLGLVTQTEMAERARMMVGVLGDIPLIADADTGYGGPINVVRTVGLYHDAGVAAIQLEDQTFPKRCGHLSNKHVVDAAVFEQTIAAAIDARSDRDLLIIARTDARAPLGLDEAIQRVNRYAAAGADIAFVEAPEGVDEIERIAREVDAPLLINLAQGGLTPLVSDARLQELGYAIALHTTDVFTRSTLGALQAMCDVVGIEPADSPATPEGFFNLVGLREWTDIDTRYAQKDARSWA